MTFVSFFIPFFALKWDFEQAWLDGLKPPVEISRPSHSSQFISNNHRFALLDEILCSISSKISIAFLSFRFFFEIWTQLWFNYLVSVYNHEVNLITLDCRQWQIIKFLMVFIDIKFYHASFYRLIWNFLFFTLDVVQADRVW